MQEMRGEDGTPVLLLNAEGQSRVFCLPPIAGFGFEYKGLAALMPSYTLYGFDFIEQEQPVAIYVQQIRHIQEEGPYVLLGYSAGGNLAYEVAKALEEQGQTVSDVILLDAARKEEAVLEKMEETERQTEEQLKSAEAKYGEFLRFPTVRRQVARRMNRYRMYMNALINGGSVQANIHLIRSEQTTVMQYSWQKSTAANYTECLGSGTHTEMLEGECLAKNSALISEKLQRTSYAHANSKG
jgi:thioesterase domain-containing protein